MDCAVNWRIETIKKMLPNDTQLIPINSQADAQIYMIKKKLRIRAGYIRI